MRQQLCILIIVLLTAWEWPVRIWNRPSSAVTSADDFVPQVPHGFKEHAVQNSYNSLLQGQFYWGDWDMFFSSHEGKLAEFPFSAR